MTTKEEILNYLRHGKTIVYDTDNEFIKNIITEFQIKNLRNIEYNDNDMSGIAFIETYEGLAYIQTDSFSEYGNYSCFDLDIHILEHLWTEFNENKEL